MNIEIKINGELKEDYPLIVIYPNENSKITTKKDITFNELYLKMKKEWYEKLSPNTCIQYDSAYKKLSPIYNKKINKLKTKELQDIINPYIYTKG